MNIKRIMAYGAYYIVWCAIFYGILILAETAYKDYNYNVNIVSIFFGLILACLVVPFMNLIKSVINEKYP